MRLIEPPAAEGLYLVVWDVSTCAGRVALAIVEERRGGMVRLRVGDDVLLLGEDEVVERVSLAREAGVWDRRARAHGGRV